MSDNDTINEWVEWKRQCALGLCGQSTRLSLASHVARRFRALCQRFAYTTSSRESLLLELDNNQCWHLFETHVLVKQTREGKRYKDWVFAKVAASSDAPISALRGAFDGYIRDAAKEYLRHNYASSKFSSLDASAFRDDHDGETCLDYLFGPASTRDEVIRNEYERIGHELGRRVFMDMNRRERIASLARALEVALSHPVVLKTAGCKKSVLTETHTHWQRKIAMAIKNEYAGEGAECVAALVWFVLTEANELSKKWGQTEKDCRQILEIEEVNGP